MVVQAAPEPTGLDSNDPNEPVELVPVVALALGPIGVQNTHYFAWLHFISPSMQSAWIVKLLTVGTVTDLTASHAIVTYNGQAYNVTNQCQAVVLTLQNVGAIAGIS